MQLQIAHQVLTLWCQLGIYNDMWKQPWVCQLGTFRLMLSKKIIIRGSLFLNITATE